MILDFGDSCAMTLLYSLEQSAYPASAESISS